MSTIQHAQRSPATELALWTILAVSLVLSAAHDLPTAARDAGAVASGLVALALFVGRVSHLCRVA